MHSIMKYLALLVLITLLACNSRSSIRYTVNSKAWHNQELTLEEIMKNPYLPFIESIGSGIDGFDESPRKLVYLVFSTDGYYSDNEIIFVFEKNDHTLRTIYRTISEIYVQSVLNDNLWDKVNALPIRYSSRETGCDDGEIGIFMYKENASVKYAKLFFCDTLLYRMRGDKEDKVLATIIESISKDRMYP